MKSQKTSKDLKKRLEDIKKNDYLQKLGLLPTVLIPIVLLFCVGLSILGLFNTDLFYSRPSYDETNIINSDDELKITFETTDNKKIDILAEVANTQTERERGLMDRTSLEWGRGMIFIFPEEEMRAFWMKNTYISLDMIFVDADKTIVTIQRNTEPLDTNPRYPSSSPAMYVIEVNGGWADFNKVKEGSKIYF